MQKNVQLHKVKKVNFDCINFIVLQFNDMLLISVEQRSLVPGMSDKLRIRQTFYLNDTKVSYKHNKSTKCLIVYGTGAENFKSISSIFLLQNNKY